jgi:hypothetical protein
MVEACRNRVVPRRAIAPSGNSSPKKSTRFDGSGAFSVLLAAAAGVDCDGPAFSCALPLIDSESSRQTNAVISTLACEFRRYRRGVCMCGSRRWAVQDMPQCDMSLFGMSDAAFQPMEPVDLPDETPVEFEPRVLTALPGA